MGNFLKRLAGVLLLTFAILVPGCQAVFQTGSSINAPQQLSPHSFNHGR
jgi:hypothetical protein